MGSDIWCIPQYNAKVEGREEIPFRPSKREKMDPAYTEASRRVFAEIPTTQQTYEDLRKTS